ncbi:DUF5067 domain-containing protein [Corynebacterium vitaeruminis]|uniref:DUF5067 domain-containing protein n=1 Tax=Corynebacterium vitaeruminis TaxID=38305 RepID=UPI0005532339|nr:DUF5067 domain-containing protein [Corynebacterium vitaeruminis]
MKKSLLIAASLAAAASLTLSACSSDDSSGNGASQGTEASATTAQASALEGTWKQTNSADPSRQMEAVITDNSITVYWPAETNDDKPIFWIGSFDEGAAAQGGTITSTRDKSATDSEFVSSLYASDDDTKDFLVGKDKISFSVSVQGLSTTVEMKKESDAVPTPTAVRNSDAANSFENGTLETAKLRIKITDSKIIHPGEPGNEYDDKPLLVFYYDITNKTDEDLTSSDWVLYFDAYQDNDPDIVNQLDVGPTPSYELSSSSLEKIKKGGTTQGATSYYLDDEVTPVDLVAHLKLDDTEIGRQTFPVS